MRQTVAAAQTKLCIPVKPGRKRGQLATLTRRAILLTRSHIHSHTSPGRWSRVPAASTQHANRINGFQKAEEEKDAKNVNTVRRIRADHTAGRSGGKTPIALWFLLVIRFQPATCWRDQTGLDPARFSARQTSAHRPQGLYWLATVTTIWQSSLLWSHL